MNRIKVRFNSFEEVSDEISANPNRRRANFIALHPDTWKGIKKLFFYWPGDNIELKEDGNSCRRLEGYKVVTTRAVKPGEIRFLQYVD
jgi:hypothetical protein